VITITAVTSATCRPPTPEGHSGSAITCSNYAISPTAGPRVRRLKRLRKPGAVHVTVMALKHVKAQGQLASSACRRGPVADLRLFWWSCRESNPSVLGVFSQPNGSFTPSRVLESARNYLGKHRTVLTRSTAADNDRSSLCRRESTQNDLRMRESC
jgi:hypothetical protein